MFGNNGNNGGRSQEPSTNTRLATWYSDYSCLQVGFWNQNLSLRFNVATGKNADGVNQYDFNNKLSTALTPAKAKEIAQWASTTAFDPSGKKKSIAVKVSTGETTKIAVEFVPTGDGETGDFFICVYRNIKEDGTTQDAVKYKFNSTKFLYDWDNESGKFGAEAIRANEFYEFIDFCLECAKYSEETFKNHYSKYLSDRAAAYSQLGNGNGNNNFNSGGSNYEAPVSSDGSFPF